MNVFNFSLYIRPGTCLIRSKILSKRYIMLHHCRVGPRTTQRGRKPRRGSQPIINDCQVKGGNVFICVCLYIRAGSHVTISHDAFDLTVQGPRSLDKGTHDPPGPGHAPSGHETSDPLLVIFGPHH